MLISFIAVVSVSSWKWITPCSQSARARGARDPRASIKATFSLSSPVFSSKLFRYNMFPWCTSCAGDTKLVAIQLNVSSFFCSPRWTSGKFFSSFLPQLPGFRSVKACIIFHHVPFSYSQKEIYETGPSLVHWLELHWCPTDLFSFSKHHTAGMNLQDKCSWESSGTKHFS